MGEVEGADRAAIQARGGAGHVAVTGPMDGHGMLEDFEFRAHGGLVRDGALRSAGGGAIAGPVLKALSVAGLRCERHGRAGLETAAALRATVDANGNATDGSAGGGRIDQDVVSPLALDRFGFQGHEVVAIAAGKVITHRDEQLVLTGVQGLGQFGRSPGCRAQPMPQVAQALRT